MKKIIKNLTKILLLLALVITVCVILERPTTADVGYHSSYSGGSSSSHSSSSHSSSSHSSSSHSSSGSSYSSSSSSDSSGGGFAGIIGFIVIVVIMLIINNIKKPNTNNNVVYTAHQSPDNTNNVEAQVRAVDPMFSAENFMAWSREVFIKLQNAWMDRKWEDIRPLESSELFEQHRGQLQYLIDHKQINMMEKICVRHTHLNSYRRDGDKEIIVMTLKAAMRDYTIEEDTKKVVQGNPNEDIYMVYTLTFMRKAGVKTKEGTADTNTTNCPNCGAPTKITSSGKCEYCGSIITTGEHDWVLSGLEGTRGM